MTPPRLATTGRAGPGRRRAWPGRRCANSGDGRLPHPAAPTSASKKRRSTFVVPSRPSAPHPGGDLPRQDLGGGLDPGGVRPRHVPDAALAPGWTTAPIGRRRRLAGRPRPAAPEGHPLHEGASLGPRRRRRRARQEQDTLGDDGLGVWYPDRCCFVLPPPLPLRASGGTTETMGPEKALRWLKEDLPPRDAGVTGINKHILFQIVSRNCVMLYAICFSVFSQIVSRNCSVIGIAC
ncbi:unnamed protein product [Urochloa humidicola]